MEKKTVTIQTNSPKKGRLDQRSFTCQVYEDKDQRVYILDDTKRDLTLKRFNLTKGCRVIEDGITYFINEVRYSPRSSRPVLIVDPKIII